MTSTSTPTPETGYALRGNVHGGQQPIAGAHVYLLAANTTGYGGNGIPASALNASVSLLTNVPGSTTLDTSGGPTNGDYYVTTAADGSFSITNDYTCTQNTQVYLYALGGNPGAGANPAAGLLAILGNCPSAQTFANQASTSFVWINEVSTIAAAYAFAGFATDATHVSSSGTALAKTGIANAFANAANLASLSTGVALATTPAGNGTVPQSKINTLANILASCVNSTGAVTGPTNPSTCYALFTNAINGISTPADTANAAINIAHNPAANVTALYAIRAPTAAFPNPLQNQPNDFAIAINFAASLVYPSGVAIDASGNAWIANAGVNYVTKLSPAGAILSGVSGFTGGGLDSPRDLAIDTSGNVWVTNYSNNSITELSNSGAPVSGSAGYTGGGLNEPNRITVDASGNVWVTNYASASTSGGSISELAAATASTPGAAISGITGYDNLILGNQRNYGGIAVDGSGAIWTSNTTGQILLVVASQGTNGAGSITAQYQDYGTYGSIAIDGMGNAWLGGQGSGTIVEVSNTGVLLLGPYTGGTSGSILGGGIYSPHTIAIDGAGNAWLADNTGGLTAISSSGQFLTGSNALRPGYNNGAGVAVDGSGNVWMTFDYAAGIVSEVIGAAAPVITPIAAGLPAIPTTDGTSNLGTRP